MKNISIILILIGIISIGGSSAAAEKEIAMDDKREVIVYKGHKGRRRACRLR